MQSSSFPYKGFEIIITDENGDGAYGYTVSKDGEECVFMSETFNSFDEAKKAAKKHVTRGLVFMEGRSARMKRNSSAQWRPHRSLGQDVWDLIVDSGSGSYKKGRVVLLDDGWKAIVMHDNAGGVMATIDGLPSIERAQEWVSDVSGIRVSRRAMRSSRVKTSDSRYADVKTSGRLIRRRKSSSWTTGPDHDTGGVVHYYEKGGFKAEVFETDAGSEIHLWAVYDSSGDLVAEGDDPLGFAQDAVEQEIDYLIGQKTSRSMLASKWMWSEGGWKKDGDIHFRVYSDDAEGYVEKEGSQFSWIVEGPGGAVIGEGMSNTLSEAKKSADSAYESKTARRAMHRNSWDAKQHAATWFEGYFSQGYVLASYFGEWVSRVMDDDFEYSYKDVVGMFEDDALGGVYVEDWIDAFFETRDEYGEWDTSRAPKPRTSRRSRKASEWRIAAEDFGPIASLWNGRAKAAYRRGWRASQNDWGNTLEKADLDGRTDCDYWYSGYMDSSTGRDMWELVADDGSMYVKDGHTCSYCKA